MFSESIQDSQESEWSWSSEQASYNVLGPSLDVRRLVDLLT